MTLGEKITHHLDKVRSKNVISQIGDSFYAPVEEQGSIFMLRRTDLQRDGGRTLNIVDEIEIEEREMRNVQEEEEKKDMTYDTFIEEFTPHIDGTATNEREGNESADEAPEDGKKSVGKGTASKKSIVGSQFNADQDSVENAKSYRSSRRSNMDGSKY